MAVQALSTGIEEELTCQICAELYKDPVQLPCQHSFCRECLNTYVKSLDTDDRLTELCSNEQRESCCPVCRTPFDLGEKGVPGLPKHFTVANIVEKFQKDQPKEQLVLGREPTQHLCSVCTYDPPRAAIKRCLTCKIIYCQECLDLMHPMRGALQKHQLVQPNVVVEEPCCSEHDKPLEMYCMDCNCRICYLCDRLGHREHHVTDTKKAEAELRKRFDDELELLKSSQRKLPQILSEWRVLLQDAEKLSDKEAKRWSGTNMAFEKWREERQVYVHEHLGIHLDKVRGEIKNLEDKTEELTATLEFDSPATKGLGELAKRTTQLKQMRSSTEKLLEVTGYERSGMTQRLSTLKLSNPKLTLMEQQEGGGDMVVRVKDKTIRCPAFRWKYCLDNQYGSLTTDGRQFINVREDLDDTPFPCAIADIGFSASDMLVYWETDVTYRVKQQLAHGRLIYSVGLIHANAPLPHYTLPESRAVWCVGLYNIPPFSFEARYDGDPVGDTIAVRTPDGCRHGYIRHGFLLNAEDRSLIVTENNEDTILHTFTNLDMSAPLTPIADAHNHDWVQTRIVLRTGDAVPPIPSCLTDLLGC